MFPWHPPQPLAQALTKHLIAEGLARRQGQRVVFARDLLGTLQNRKLDALGARIVAETGLPRDAVAERETVYRDRLTLGFGRVAMIDDCLGFQLVPSSPSLGKEIGKQVSCVMSPSGGVDWNIGRKQGTGR